MIVSIGTKTYVSAFNDGSTVLRTARKGHRCAGGHDGTKHVTCLVPIVIGSEYIEYIGECGPFQSGKRYHKGCAVLQGLLHLFEKGNG
jgi:hypothetical protein